ncbi:acyl-CoA dehydrogenase [Conexibacter sp. W3-3-2]|uniref:Acyl-CoA dehydrogenase n=1 Tax=Paraconexibacter algicola TaxID=2133960 RepID=A0A2T4UGS6_9ACTN|nr:MULTISPECIES: acyl-CoA dehydrogenase family protein [Solirubrobacterales]MTD44678.1 acyl-CoA dehydrogenase [Conexibacter sp. W3-3-2]PTL58418.1 acyl-CoA dehydrogenase [Paraconexibacter algicola]
MSLELTADQHDYRDRLRAWLDEHGADAPRRHVLEPQDDAAVARLRAWQGRLSDAGYVGVTWPARFGGPGGTPAEAVIVDQELEARGIAGPFDFIGIGMVGPTIMAHGTPEQQERHLAPLLRGDEFWCQLLSEPGAGSDLAAVQTRARRREDGAWVVNGQKVWTSFAQHAAFGILLARTDPAVAKHKGLSMFLVPMDSDGLTIRPLRQITGDAEFNEVFLDDLVLPADAMIGAEGEGWKVALTMLGFERVAVGSGLHAVRLERLVAAIAEDPAAREDHAVRVRMGQVASQLLALRHTSERVVREIAEGRVPGPDAGLIKITSVIASLDACRFVVDAIGPDALVDGEWGHQVSALPGVRSAGGTEEILRNLIGERHLGLPPEPRVAPPAPAAPAPAPAPATV